MLGRPNQGIRAIAVGAAVMAAAGGCLFDPFASRLRRAQEAAVGLDQRIVVLERAAVVGGSLSSSRAGAAPETLPGALPVSSSDLPVNGLPVPSAASVGQASMPAISRWPSLPIDWRKAMGKLLRGLVNVITGWVEIPKRVHETTETSGAGAGFTWGLMRGFGFGFIRTAAGAYETATFPVPAPPDYQPVMRPPYVFVCDAGESRPSEEPVSSSGSIICPAGGEPVPSTYRYCPRHGVELHAP